MVYWASILAVLGWLYVILGTSWHRLFRREAVRNAIREASGYRIGRLVYWQPPRRIALLVAGLSFGPILTVLIFKDLLALLLLATMSVTLPAIWLLGAPGQVLHYVEQGKNEGGGLVFELRRGQGVLRSLAILLLLGLLPAAGLGTLLGRWLTRFVP